MSFIDRKLFAVCFGSCKRREGFGSVILFPGFFAVLPEPEDSKPLNPQTPQPLLGNLETSLPRGS